jgi:hypothetical protein
VKLFPNDDLEHFIKQLKSGQLMAINIPHSKYGFHLSIGHHERIETSSKLLTAANKMPVSMYE